MKNLDAYLTRQYLILYKMDQATDGSVGYLAWHPELPGCMSDGDTVQAAIENLKDARRMFIESLLEDDLPVPEPHTLGTYVLLRPAPDYIPRVDSTKSMRPTIQAIHSLA